MTPREWRECLIGCSLGLVIGIVLVLAHEAAPPLGEIVREVLR